MVKISLKSNLSVTFRDSSRTNLHHPRISSSSVVIFELRMNTTQQTTASWQAGWQLGQLATLIAKPVADTKRNLLLPPSIYKQRSKLYYVFLSYPHHYSRIVEKECESCLIYYNCSASLLPPDCKLNANLSN